jgi:hypothetical protein
LSVPGEPLIETAPGVHSSVRLASPAEAIGARVLLVHAKHEAAKAWYMRFAFEESPTDRSTY